MAFTIHFLFVEQGLCHMAPTECNQLSSGENHNLLLKNTSLWSKAILCHDIIWLLRSIINDVIAQNNNKLKENMGIKKILQTLNH